MARSTNLQGGRDNAPQPKKIAIEVENSEVVYEGAFASLRDLGNATAGNQGRIGAYTGAAGEVFAGVALGIQDPNVSENDGDWTFDGSVTGDTSASIPPKAGLSVEPQVLKKIAVTGASAISDQGRPVYLSDDDTLTLTPPTRMDPIGFVSRWYTSTTCDVYLLPVWVQYACARPERLFLSTEPATLTGTSGDLATGYPMPFKGLVLGVGYVITTDITGSPDTVLNAELDGTNVTGGTLALATGSAGAYAVASSFATAAHYFSRGSLLDIEISGATGATAGAGSLFIDVIRLPGS